MLYGVKVLRVAGSILLVIIGWFSGVLNGFGATDPPESGAIGPGDVNTLLQALGLSSPVIAFLIIKAIISLIEIARNDKTAHLQNRELTLKIKAFERSSSEQIIKSATLDDVKKYDPKILKIEQRIQSKP